MTCGKVSGEAVIIHGKLSCETVMAHGQVSGETVGNMELFLAICSIEQRDCHGIWLIK